MQQRHTRQDVTHVVNVHRQQKQTKSLVVSTLDQNASRDEAGPPPEHE